MYTAHPSHRSFSHYIALPLHAHFDLAPERLDAVGKLDQLDRKTVRNTFDKRFTARRMANDYVDIYRSLVNKYNNVGQMPLHAANGNAATFAIGDTA